MAIQVSVSCEQLERVEKLLYGIPGAVEKARANAFNRGLETARTTASKEIRKRYAIAAGNLKKKITVKRASAGGGNASIEFAGPKIPLYKYTPSPKSRTYTTERVPVEIRENVWRLVHKTGRVSAMDSRESGMQARPSAFIATFSSGHTGIFRRVGGNTENGKAKIEEYWSYSIADMLDYGPAKEAVAEKTAETVNRRLEHEISRVLGEY